MIFHSYNDTFKVLPQVHWRDRYRGRTLVNTEMLMNIRSTCTRQVLQYFQYSALFENSIHSIARLATQAYFFTHYRQVPVSRSSKVYDTLHKWNLEFYWDKDCQWECNKDCQFRHDISCSLKLKYVWKTRYTSLGLASYHSRKFYLILL